ncbi:pyroglutamyl-peptidase I [Caldibacillus lycopersici]|uniref:Pyroglutamyl-peptidase I n=1 Tax=Perspicuibacillus lycopersici TaxID=1325689 RepID=A0AAE3ITP7_9BACI|nr:pyroglutamyl-peptidase I [Perspicuibacillus lycopersici]MCU9613281.1 pyroglutamyl-peptidase I [Perspicuibacillus lycopersici]
MKKLLLTGFEPFLQFPINPTEHIVQKLDRAIIGEYEIRGVLLPVDFEKSPQRLLEAIEKEQPDAILSLGLAGGRNCITPERVAINCKDGEPDNNGVKYEDALIAADGPAAYFSKLPIRSIVNTLRENQLPAQISNTAGTYLCNNVMYTGLHYLATKGLDIPSGFIHVPASHPLAVESKRSIPSWSNEDLVRGICLAIECL